MQHIKESKFRHMISNTLLGFLVTLPCLEQFREKVRFIAVELGEKDGELKSINEESEEIF